MAGPLEGRFAGRCPDRGFSVTGSELRCETAHEPQTARIVAPRVQPMAAVTVLAGWLSSDIEGSCYEHDMRVENCECGVEFARAEPRKIELSSNQSSGIPPSRESEAAERGRPIAARYDNFTGGAAEQLITPAAAEAEITGADALKSLRVRCPQSRSCHDEDPDDSCSTQPKGSRRSVCFLTYGCDCEIMSPSAAIRKVTANAASYLTPFGRQGDELSPFP